MYYEPSTQWVAVVLVRHIGHIDILLTICQRHIIGRAPLMRSFVGGGVTGTIPHCFARHRQSHFEQGKADLQDGSRLGSKLFEFNPYAWSFGRALVACK